METKSINTDKPPVTNCHAHIFTGHHVPPFLARTFIPSVFAFLLNINRIVVLFRKTLRSYRKIKYSNRAKNIVGLIASIRSYRKYYGLPVSFFGYFILIQFIVQFILHASDRFNSKFWISIYDISSKLQIFFSNISLWIPDYVIVLKSLFIIFLFIFLPSARNFLKFVFRFLAKIPGLFAGTASKSMLSRYLNIVFYANYKEQRRIFLRLKQQYPKDTCFVILPMDMEFMKAGKPPISLESQLEDLVNLKKKNPKTVYPFIFADPERISAQEDFFRYDHSEGKIILSECVVKTLLEEKEFSGIKIYPALGYYPFDERLLPLWKYAADNKIPVTTHCSKGPIFYRGSKKKEWNRHPVFEQISSKNRVEYLSLPQPANLHFTTNFTHPLNYLCLLEEKLLRKLVSKSSDGIKEIFGYTNDEVKMKYNLEHLRICFAHFGGEDEWIRHLELDRDNYSSQIYTKPEGIDFAYNRKGNVSIGKTEEIWKKADWLSIIVSLMLKYPEVYADISYISHADKKILPTLIQLLRRKDDVPNRILFGSDFYVVRNHKSDRELVFNIEKGMPEREFDLIARHNPIRFLNL